MLLFYKYAMTIFFFIEANFEKCVNIQVLICTTYKKMNNNPSGIMLYTLQLHIRTDRTHIASFYLEYILSSLMYYPVK